MEKDRRRHSAVAFANSAVPSPRNHTGPYGPYEPYGPYKPYGPGSFHRRGLWKPWLLTGVTGLTGLTVRPYGPGSFTEKAYVSFMLLTNFTNGPGHTRGTGPYKHYGPYGQVPYIRAGPYGLTRLAGLASLQGLVPS